MNARKLLLILIVASLGTGAALAKRRALLIGPCEPHRDGGCRTCADCSRCDYCHTHLGECSVCEGKAKK